MINRMLCVLILALWCTAGAMAQGSANDPGERDTMYVQSVEVDPGQKADVEIYFVNDSELAALTIPLTWDSPDITLDTVLFTGSRIDYIGTKPITIDNGNRTVVFGAIVFFEANIPPGTGLMATLQFDIPPGTPDQLVTVDSITVGPAGLLFTNPDATNFTPEFQSGTITIGEPSFPPHIELAPDSMMFEAIVGYPPPGPQSLSITNTGQGTLVWSASFSSSWLSVNPSSGTAPSATAIRVDHAALPEGTYFDTVFISAPDADNSPQGLPIRLEVVTLPPNIVVSPSSFNVSAVQDGLDPDDRVLNISTDVPGSELNWTVSNSAGWLGLSPASGTPPDSVTLSFDITGLAFGLYYDTIVVSDPAAVNDPVKVPVTLQIVSDLPVLELDPDTLHVIAVTGNNAPPKSFDVWNSGEGVMNYSATESSKYITGLSPSTGTAPQAVTVSFATSILAAGDYYDTITVTSAEAINSPQELIVHFHISDSPARLALIPGTMQFNIFECWQGPNAVPPIKTLQIENTGGDSLSWWLTHNSDWLIISETSGEDDAVILLRPDISVQYLPLGSYYDTVTVYSNEAINSPQRLPVTLDIVPGAEDPEIGVGNTIVDIPAQEVFGTSYGLAAVVEVYNQNPGCMDYFMEENIPWLYFVDSTGSAPALPRAGLDVGTYTWGVYPDSFYVNSDQATNSPVKVYVNMLVWRLHGDFNWDNRINIADVVDMLDFIFRNGPDPQPEYLVGDCNCDWFVNIEDATYLIDYIFKNGDEPCGNP